MKPLQTVYGLRLALGVIAALICIGYGLATGTIYKNSILNASVEAGETGAVTPQYWSPSGLGAVWSTAHSRTGSRSLRVNVTSASAEWKSDVAVAQEGSAYQISGFFTGDVTVDQFSLTVKWFSDLEGLYFLDESNVPIPVGNSSLWARLGGVFAAPARTKSCELVFRAVNGSGDIYGDDFEVRQTESLTKLMNGMSIAIIVYIVSYYIMKPRFALKVDKPRRIFTMGIGIYFLAWLVFWVLLYTMIAGI